MLNLATPVDKAGIIFTGGGLHLPTDYMSTIKRGLVVEAGESNMDLLWNNFMPCSENYVTKA